MGFSGEFKGLHRQKWGLKVVSHGKFAHMSRLIVELSGDEIISYNFDSWMGS